MTIKNEISVVLVDDSSVIRGALSRIIEKDPQIKIVASVSNGQMGVSMASSKKPDVLILDVEMPVMDGLTALPKILEASPETKVVMCSSLTAKGADTTMKAMALGAVECLVKPNSAQDTGSGSAFETMLISLIKSLGNGSQTQESKEKNTSTPLTGKHNHVRPDDSTHFELRDDFTTYKGKPRILAIGSSTGGPQALFNVIKHLKGLTIPIVITQHMPATFTTILAQHITQQCGVEAIEGQDNMIVEAGKAYVAPGGKHMLFEQVGTSLHIKLNDGPMENFCKPAVDPMLRSLISIYDQRVLCAILTGMGSDGMLGAKELVEKNGRVIAQDKNTSVVWGMPGAVATEGLCSAVLPLDEIGLWLKRAC